MANAYVALPVPAGDGVGAWVDTSQLGATKTISVDGGAFSGTLFIESSNDAQVSAAPVNCGSFSGGTSGPVEVVAAVQFMRVRRSGSSAGPLGAPSVKVGAEQITAGQIFAAMPVPAADGVGAGVDLSSGGPVQTFNIVGPYTGQVVIEVSTDAGATWSPALLFGLPSVLTPAGGTSANFAGVVAQVRVRRQGTIPGPAPVVSVGSGTDQSTTPATASSADTFDITLSYGLGNQFEQQLPDAARSFWLSPRTTGDTADASQVREWVNDQTLGFLGVDVCVYSSTVPAGGLPLKVTINGADTALTLTVANGIAAATVLEVSTLIAVPAGSTIGLRVDGSSLAAGMSLRMTARVHGAATGTPTIPNTMPAGGIARYIPTGLALDGRSWQDDIPGHVFNLTVPAGGPPFRAPVWTKDGSFQNQPYALYSATDFTNQQILSTTVPMFAQHAAPPLAARSVVAVIKPSGPKGGIVCTWTLNSPDFQCRLYTHLGTQSTYSNDNGVECDRPAATNYAGQELVIVWRTDGTNIDCFINGVLVPVTASLVGRDDGTDQGFSLGNRQFDLAIEGMEGGIAFTEVWPFRFSDAQVAGATAAATASYV